MSQFIKTLGLLLTAGSFVSAIPTPTAAPDISNAVALNKRDACTFAGATGAAAASKAKANCASMIPLVIVHVCYE
jgi:polygalacturonase